MIHYLTAANIIIKHEILLLPSFGCLLHLLLESIPFIQKALLRYIESSASFLCYNLMVLLI